MLLITAHYHCPHTQVIFKHKRDHDIVELIKDENTQERSQFSIILIYYHISIDSNEKKKERFATYSLYIAILAFLQSKNSIILSILCQQGLERCTQVAQAQRTKLGKKQYRNVNISCELIIWS